MDEDTGMERCAHVDRLDREAAETHLRRVGELTNMGVEVLGRMFIRKVMGGTVSRDHGNSYLWLITVLFILLLVTTSEMYEIGGIERIR